MTRNAIPAVRVLWSTDARKFLAMFKGELPVAGRKRLVEAVRWFQDRLSTDPLNVGEVYKSKGAIAQHLAVKDLLATDFAVDQVHSLVGAVLSGAFGAWAGRHITRGEPICEIGADDFDWRD
jgi:hypothetical protein